MTLRRTFASIPETLELLKQKKQHDPNNSTAPHTLACTRCSEHLRQSYSHAFGRKLATMSAEIAS